MTTQLKSRKKNSRKPHWSSTVGQQRNSNDKAKKDKWSDAEEDDEEDKSLVLGKYKYLEDVPREVGLTRAEHAKLVKRELKRDPWKYTVRQVSTYELLLVSLMIILPSLIYSYMLIKLPESKYRVPLS